MRYNQCGDLRVSEVGVGCYSLAGVYGKKDLDEFARMVRRAYELGVTFFDTADAYGDAESILEACSKMPPKKGRRGWRRADFQFRAGESCQSGNFTIEIWRKAYYD